MAPADLRIPVGPPGHAGVVTVTHRVIAKLAGKTAHATYGVVAMQEPHIRKLGRFFRGSLSEGIELEVGEGSVDIGLHVIMERGVNLAQVTTNLQEQVKYQLAEVAGLPLGEVSVRVEDLKD